MDATHDLAEVPCDDGRWLWLGVSVDWTFGAEGADYHLPLLMWMLGARDEDDQIILDRDEPFVTLHRALQLAPDEREEMLDEGRRLVNRIRRDIGILGFGPQHPYRDEIRRFTAEMSRARRAATVSDVELTGSRAAKPAGRLTPA